MAILSYQSEEPLNREAMAISFDVPDDMNIGEFKIMCIRMASSMGYQPSSINSVFGENDIRIKDENEFEAFLNSLDVTTGSFTI